MIINKRYILYTTGELSTLNKISQLKEIELIRVKDYLVGIQFYEKYKSEDDIEEYNNYIQAMLQHISKIPGVIKIKEYIETDVYKRYHIGHPSDAFIKLCGLNSKWGKGIYFGDVIEYAAEELTEICPLCLDAFCEMADSLSVRYGDRVKVNKICQIDDKCDGWNELCSHLDKETIIEGIEIIRGFQIDKREKPEELFAFKLKSIDNELWTIDELSLIKKADRFIGMKEYIKIVRDMED